jgi:hypothetical protein
MSRPLRASHPKEIGQTGIAAGKFALIVGTDRGLDGFTSSDGCSALMEEFLKSLDLPYLKTFVCASVRPLPSTKGVRGISQPTFCSADNYGQPHVLKPELIPRVLLVCAGDFQNVMTQALLAYLRHGQPLSEFRQYFWDLSDSNLDVAVKMESIWKAHRKVGQIKKKFGDYAEVRLPGPASKDWSSTVTDPFSSSLAENDPESEIEFE